MIRIDNAKREWCWQLAGSRWIVLIREPPSDLIRIDRRISDDSYVKIDIEFFTTLTLKYFKFFNKLNVFLKTNGEHRSKCCESFPKNLWKKFWKYLSKSILVYELWFESAMLSGSDVANKRVRDGLYWYVIPHRRESNLEMGDKIHVSITAN